MTKWCSLLQLMVPLVVWLCEETERAISASKYQISSSSTLANKILVSVKKKLKKNSNTVKDMETKLPIVCSAAIWFHSSTLK